MLDFVKYFSICLHTSHNSYFIPSSQGSVGAIALWDLNLSFHQCRILLVLAMKSLQHTMVPKYLIQQHLWKYFTWSPHVRKPLAQPWLQKSFVSQSSFKSSKNLIVLTNSSCSSVLFFTFSTSWKRSFYLINYKLYFSHRNCSISGQINANISTFSISIVSSLISSLPAFQIPHLLLSDHIRVSRQQKTYTPVSTPNASPKNFQCTVLGKLLHLQDGIFMIL